MPVASSVEADGRKQIPARRFVELQYKPKIKRNYETKLMLASSYLLRCLAEVGDDRHALASVARVVDRALGSLLGKHHSNADRVRLLHVDDVRQLPELGVVRAASLHDELQALVHFVGELWVVRVDGETGVGKVRVVNEDCWVVRLVGGVGRCEHQQHGAALIVLQDVCKTFTF